MTTEEITAIWINTPDTIEFARAIEAKVREECAKFCDDRAQEYDKQQNFIGYASVANTAHLIRNLK